jgi:hypothetical protein
MALAFAQCGRSFRRVSGELLFSDEQIGSLKSPSFNLMLSAVEALESYWRPIATPQ